MEYHSHVLTECVPEDANELEAAAEASEEEKARPYYTRENPDDTRDLHMHNINQTPARRRPIDLIQVAVRFNDPLIPNRLSDEKPALFDTGANASFISLRLVQLWGLKILGRPSSIKNGDGTVQYSPGQVNIKVLLAYGFTVNVCLTVAPLARYDMIIGLDMIKTYEMSLAFNPLRLTAVPPTLSHKKGTKQKVPKRINIPTCALASFDAEGRDTSAYACDANQFNNLRRLDNIYAEEDVFVVTPSDNDCLNYNLIVKELFDLANKCSAEEFSTVAHTLLQDLAEPDCADRKESVQKADIGKDSSKTKFTAPSAHPLSDVEAKFRSEIATDYPDLCSDSLPLQGPSALLPDGTPYTVKLRLKPGMEPESRRAFRIPEAYRAEMRKTIDDLLKYKLIEPSVSPYSNPVFLVPKPPRPDGSYAGLRFVFDGRSINRALQFDSHMIPRVEELIDRIAILKHEAERAGKKEMIISTLDQKTSFWQLALDKESRPLTSFNADGSCYQWTCLPMGVLTASAHLQRFTEALLKPFSSSTFEYETTDSQGAKIVATAFGMAMGYIDDCCVVTFGTVEEHEILLRRVLSAMQKQNVRLTPAKCEFFRTSAAFLGHVLSAEGISQQDKKLDAIKKWPIPTDLKQMRAFVSLCSYYRKFVHKFAEIAKPLTDLLRDGGWHYPFSAEVLQAIDKLKTALTTAPVLRYFDYLAKTELYVDACDYAIGAVLQQVDSEGNSHPVGYYSRRLNPAECNYDVYKKELLGLRDAVLNFRHQLLGIRFTVYTDNCALQWLFKQKEITGQQARWAAVLSEYMIENITHIPGVKNIPADALSRHPMEGGEQYDHLIPTHSNMDTTFSNALDLQDDADDEEDTSGTDQPGTLTTKDYDTLMTTDPFEPLGINPDISKPTLNDGVDQDQHGYDYEWSISAPLDIERLSQEYDSCQDFGTIYQKLSSEGSSHQYPEYVIRNDGLLFHCDRHRFRLCIPTAMRSDLLSILHDDPIGGHVGSRKMFAIAALRFYWPEMRSHIRAFVSTCDLCQRNKPYNANTRGIPTPLPIPKRRFDVVALDIVSGFPKDKHGNDAAVVFTDRLTKRAWVEACSKDVTARDLSLIFMRTVFRSQGLPSTLLSDRGPQFISSFWKELFGSLKTQVRLTSGYHPASNGGSERFNRTLIEGLRSFVNTRHSDWSDYLLYLEFTYNNSVNPATGYSPFVLQFAQTPRGPIDLISGPVDDGADDFDSSNLKSDAARTLSIEIMNNVTEARDHLHEAARRFRERHARICKPHDFALGEEILLSSKNIHFVGGCRKLSPSFIGPFKIEKLVGNNAVEIKPTGPYRSLHKIVNVEYLRPYNRRPQAVGHPPSQDRTAPILVDPDGREWFIVAEILSHRQFRPGPDQKVRVRFEGFDSTYDEWLPRKDVTDAALIEYEKFLEKNASDNGFKGDAQKAYTSFVGVHGRFSLLHKPTQGAAENRTTTRRESRNEAGRAGGSAQQESAKTSKVSGHVVGRKTTRYSEL